MEVLIIGITSAVIIVLVLLLKSALSEQGNRLASLVQQQTDSVRTEFNQNLKLTTDSMAQNLKNTSELLFQSLKNTTDAINQQMANLTKQLQTTTGQVGSRLDNAAKVIGEVQKNLGELGKATQEIKELGQSVSKLDEILRAPKLRGGLGEFLLEDLLKQVLPREAYQMQYRFRNGTTVDAVIRTSGGMVPVDSKFPLENFRKFSVAQSEVEKKSLYKAFIKDVKLRIDEIASRYILPDEGTFDFALMYIPAENIYYETIIRNEEYGADEPLYAYYLKKNVVPVSPNSFYAHLVVISLGLKGMQIEKSAKQIVQNLSRLQGDLQQFVKDFDTLGSHLNNAKNKYDESARKLDTLGERLSRVSTEVLPAGEVKRLERKLEEEQQKFV
jgi:DNA recombination protein RmuC